MSKETIAEPAETIRNIQESHIKNVKIDQVNSPHYYQIFPDMQALDVIQHTLTIEEYQGFLKGNILKYRLRAGAKDPGKTQQDIDKANYYQKKLYEL